MLNELINASLSITLTGLPFFLASLWLTYVYMGVANAHGVAPLHLTSRSHSDMLSTMSRKELQAAAKAQGLKANAKTRDLINNLSRW